GRQMGKDPVGRGIEPLPAVPPRHAKGLSAIHLSIWKTEQISLCDSYRARYRAHRRNEKPGKEHTFRHGRWLGSPRVNDSRPTPWQRFSVPRLAGAWIPLRA